MRNKHRHTPFETDDFLEETATGRESGDARYATGKEAGPWAASGDYPAEDETYAPEAYDDPFTLPRPGGPRRPRRKMNIGQFFTGSVIERKGFTRLLPVVVFVVVLMLLYIGNGFRVQEKHSRIDQLDNELKRLKTLSATTTAARMSLTRQGRIEELIRQRNIPLTFGKNPVHIIDPRPPGLAPSSATPQPPVSNPAPDESGTNTGADIHE